MNYRLYLLHKGNGWYNRYKCHPEEYFSATSGHGRVLGFSDRFAKVEIGEDVGEE